MADQVTILGASGALGFDLALRLGRAGVATVVGSRDAGRARKTAEDVLVCGRLEQARIAESLTALPIGVDARYKPHAGVCLTALPGEPWPAK